MPIEHPNTVSAARDYAMLERNLLSHIRLAVLLSLSSSSLLLHARLPSSSNPASGQTPRTNAGLAIAIVEVTAALTAISAGVWEYYQGYKDMREMRGFLAASKVHLAIMSVVGLVVFATCLALIADKSV